MKFITSGKMAVLIPTQEDFEAFKAAGHTDASSREDLISRYKKIESPDVKVAMIELSLAELNEAAILHRPTLEAQLKSRSPVMPFEVERDGKKVLTNAARAGLAVVLAMELDKGNRV